VDEVQQLVAEPVAVGQIQAVRPVLVHLQPAAGDQSGGASAGEPKRRRGVSITLHDERRHVDLRQLAAKVSLRGGELEVDRRLQGGGEHVGLCPLPQEG
jgi:hypothetical protein